MNNLLTKRISNRKTSFCRTLLYFYTLKFFFFLETERRETEQGGTTDRVTEREGSGTRLKSKEKENNIRTTKLTPETPSLS